MKNTNLHELSGFVITSDGIRRVYYDGTIGSTIMNGLYCPGLVINLNYISFTSEWKPYSK